MTTAPAKMSQVLVKTLVLALKKKPKKPFELNGRIKSANETRNMSCKKKTRNKRRNKPKRNFTQNTLLLLTGLLKRKDFVFFINSLVKKIVPRNKEKRMGRIK